LKVDFIIIGQGLAGSALAWELAQRGKSLRVYDVPGDNKASSVAAGLYNPVTGHVMNQTWKADVLFPFLESFYSHAEEILSRELLHRIPVYRPFVSHEERQAWGLRLQGSSLKSILKVTPELYSDQVRNPFGGIEILNSGYLDVKLWLSAVREFLTGHGFYAGEKFEERELLMNSPLQYKGYVAEKIIFCDGCAALDSRWFGWLPVRPLKGETLEVRIGSKLERLFNRGVYVVPAAEKSIYTVGSTYEHPPFQEEPTTRAKEELTAKLGQLLNVGFETVHQGWGIRPATADRRPILGPHPANKNLVAFNGLGTKGVSLSPYFAYQMADWLDGKGDLSAEVNIYRFKALYSE
jgi:glycine oxidase